MRSHRSEFERKQQKGVPNGERLKYELQFTFAAAKWDVLADDGAKGPEPLSPGSSE